MLSEKLHIYMFVENEFLARVDCSLKNTSIDKNRNYEVMQYSEKRRVEKLGFRVISIITGR